MDDNCDGVEDESVEDITEEEHPEPSPRIPPARVWCDGEWECGEYP
jgi:hypothetical protein